MDATFEQVVKLAEQLSPEQQNLLIYRLRVKQMQERALPKKAQAVPQHIAAYRSPTREELLQEVETLRQTPVRAGDSLFGKYANPNMPEMTEEEFHAQMHTIATEWEQELDEFTDES